MLTVPMNVDLMKIITAYFENIFQREQTSVKYLTPNYAVESINNRPRKVLNWQTANTTFKLESTLNLV